MMNILHETVKLLLHARVPRDDIAAMMSEALTQLDIDEAVTTKLPGGFPLEPMRFTIADRLETVMTDFASQMKRSEVDWAEKLIRFARTRPKLSDAQIHTINDIHQAYTGEPCVSATEIMMMNNEPREIGER